MKSRILTVEEARDAHLKYRRAPSCVHREPNIDTLAAAYEALYEDREKLRRVVERGVRFADSVKALPHTNLREEKTVAEEFLHHAAAVLKEG